MVDTAMDTLEDDFELEYKDQLWDATHALAAEWVPMDIGTLEAFKTKSLGRFDARIGDSNEDINSGGPTRFGEFRCVDEHQSHIYRGFHDRPLALVA
jgi:hypothetical protein